MPLPFQPACLPLLLGSLPYRSAAHALEVSRRFAGSILAWPQLPRRSVREHALAQSVVGFPGLVIDASRGRVYVDRVAAARGLDRLGLAYLEHDLAFAALADDDASGLAELRRQRDHMRGVRALKGQLLGPISAASLLTDEQDRPLIYDGVLFEALVQHLYLRAAWQTSVLGDISPTTIICLDEPFLEAVGLPFLPLDWEQVCLQLDAVLAGVSGCKAIYAGGAVEWSRVMRTSVDLIIADVSSDGQALVAAGPSLPAFLDRDGIVGLGVVPADAEALGRATGERLLGSVRALLAALEPFGVAPERLLQRAVLSTGDTLGLLEPPVAERALQLLAELSKSLRDEYALG